MRIAWFTPYSRESAIGKYSMSVTKELAKSCHVDLWLNESNNLLPANVDVVLYDPCDDLKERLIAYDHVIYNMGNHLYNHRSIYEVSQKIRGIVVLHDVVMHHFFTGYYFLHCEDQESYVRDMETFYGDEGKQCACDSLNCLRVPIWESENVVQYPFIERSIAGALGVIVHSRFHSEQVSQTYLGPIGVLNHPFDWKQNLGGGKSLTKTELGFPKDKPMLLTIGHVNPNKQIDRVITSLGSHRDIAEKMQYVIIGPFEHGEYFSRLQQLVEHYQLADTITFKGFQPDEVLYAHMAAADGFINLRSPTIEGASWSLVEELYFGKPVIVYETGCYSELPDDCVLKIRINGGSRDIITALEKFVGKQRELSEIGARGKQFALETYTASAYCERLNRFLDIVESWRPVLRLIDKSSHELSLMGVRGNMPVINNVAKELLQFFK
jgi:glycosyltransferase involved in cell wall biosynthesis